MPPKFGTSGLRGLVRDLTPELVDSYVAAFLRACRTGTGLFVGRDLRDSSPAIAMAVIRAARHRGVAVTDCGAVPTPALALASMAADAAAVMVTGSHIPADRNGLKFYTPAGEITKAEEAAILLALEKPVAAVEREPADRPERTMNPGSTFVDRYRTAFGSAALAGRRVAIWSHSAVGRDLLSGSLAALGARTIEVGRSDQFIPIDTEAISPEAGAMLRRVAQEHGVDAIASTDGDGDRPLLADADGRIVPGDILGQLTARMLDARLVVTPVSSNTGVEACGFERVVRTRIGSPFVIDAMQALLREHPAARVVGYEANGGFILGFDARGPAGPLPALMTRDSHLPIIAPLVLAGGEKLAALVASQPARFTAADRLQGVTSDRSAALVAALSDDAEARSAFLADLGSGCLSSIDRTDGLRMILNSGRIVHLRPSGNAPELRFYTEAESPAAAKALLRSGIEMLRRRLE